MPARSADHFLLSFGALHVPVKLFATGTARPVRLNLLHANCGSRLKQQHRCPVHDVVVPRESQSRGYEVARDTLVEFSEADLDALDGTGGKQLVLERFVPLAELEPELVERTWLLGADKGGAPGCALLLGGLEQTRRAGVGRRWTRGKEQLCAVQALNGHLILQELYYPHERADLADVPTIPAAPNEHVELVSALIDQLAAADLEGLDDRYMNRVEHAASLKAAGGQLVPATEELPPATLDFAAALRASLKSA